MKIFENHIIRENILNKLSNVDSTNLMVALRPTGVWDELFEDKENRDRQIYCPICMLNTHIPILYQHSDALLFGLDWMATINTIEYPCTLALDHKVYPESSESTFGRGKPTFIFTESSNLFDHQYRFSINPNSSQTQKTDFFKKLNLKDVPFFTTEKDLVNHFEKVK